MTANIPTRLALACLYGIYDQGLLAPPGRTLMEAVEPALEASEAVLQLRRHPRQHTVPTRPGGACHTGGCHRR